MQFKQVGKLFEGEEWKSIITGGGLKANNFKTAASISDMENITAEMFNKQFKIGSSGISEFNKSQIEAKANAIGLTDSLKSEVLALASDADITDKLRSGKVTWAKAIANSGDEIDTVADALKKSGKLSDEWVTRLNNSSTDKLKQNMLDAVNATEGLADSFVNLESKTSGSGGFFSSAANLGKGLLASLKAILPYALAIGGTIAAFKIFDYAMTGYSRAKDKMDTSVQEYQEEQSNLDSLNSKLDETKSRIEELQGLKNSGTISVTEEYELERLQNQNSELERQIELQQQVVDIKKQAAANDTKKATTTEQTLYDYNKEKYGGLKGFFHTIADYMSYNKLDENGNLVPTSNAMEWKSQNDGDTTIAGQLKGNIKLLKSQQKELKKYQDSADPATRATKEFKEHEQELNDAITETKNSISEQSSTLQGYIDNVTDSNGVVTKGMEGYVRDWKNIINDVNNIGKTKNEKYLSNLENYFSSSTAGSSMKEYLSDIVKNGGSAKEALDAFRASGMRLKDIGVNENTFLRYFEDIKKQAEETSDALDSVDGSFEGMKNASESANQGANYDSTMSYYKSAKEKYENGLWGTDDFKTVAQFSVGYNIAKRLKENADAYKYASDAYVEAWENGGAARLERWYGNEDELVNMTHILEDFQSAGLAASLGDGEWTFKNDDGTMKFKTTAQAANALGTSVDNVEVALSKLEEHGFEFDGIEKSGKLLSEYKNSLDGIKTLYDSMSDGTEKDRLGKLLEGYDSECSKFEEDLSGLSEEQVVKIKFEYDLASIQQKVQELKEQAEASGSNQDWASTTVAQKQERDMLESKTGLKKDSDSGYGDSYKKITALRKEMHGANEDERADLNAQIAAVQEMQNAWQQFRLDGGQLDWKSFLDTPTATALLNNLVEKGAVTEEQIKSLFGDSIECNVEAKFDDSQLKEKLNSLSKNESITFTADVNNVATQVQALKNEDGTVTYTANIAGVPTEVNKIRNQDGTIHFTSDFDGSEDWIKNNLKNGETITYKADVSGVTQEIEVQKNQEGEIHYYSVLEDGSRERLEQKKDENGKITYVADTSKAKEQVDVVKNETENSSSTLKVDADTSNADEKIQSAKDKANENSAVFKVESDTSEVEGSTNKAKQDVENSKAEIKVGADTSDVQSSTQRLQQDLTGQKFEFGVNANVEEAKQKIAELSSEEIADKVVKLVGEDDASQVVNTWNGLRADSKFTSLSADDQATAVVALWNAVEASPKYSSLSADDRASYIIELWNGLQPEEKEAIINATDNGLESATQQANSLLNTVDQNNPSPTISVIDNASGTIGHVLVMLNSIPAAKTTTITTNHVDNYVTTSSGSGKNKLLGTAHASGTLNNTDWIKSDWQTTKDEVALTGEVGRELIVDSSSNRWWTVGDNGAEFSHIPAHAVVFNSKQTQELLSKGFTNSRGHGNPILANAPAFLGGTAYASGGRLPSKTTGYPYATNSTPSQTSNTSTNSNTSNTSSDSTKEATEEVIDWVEVLLKEMSRLTEIAVDNIDRAIGLASKQSKAYEAISRVQDEIKANQDGAQTYLNKADSVELDPAYKKLVREGALSIETITDENLKKKISEYKEYYANYEEAQDKILDLEDKLTELAEKRLEIIEKEYDSLTDINDAIKDVADAKMELNTALGTAIDNEDNFDNIKKSIQVQEDTYGQLTKKLNEYQAEINSQLSSGLLKEGSESYREAMKNVQDFTANIYKASKELIELQDKLTQIRIDSIQYIIDGFSRRSDKLDKYIAVKDAKDEVTPESIYQERLDDNNAIIQRNQEARAIWLKRQATEDVGSENYQKYAEEIQKLDESTLDLIKDNEDLKDSIYSLRIKNLEDAIQKYADLEDELSSFRDLLNDDAFLNKQGGITDEGLAQITLLSQSIANAKQKISDYATGLQKVKELYENGVISLDEYNDKSKEYRDGIQASTKDVKSYQDALTDLYMQSMKTEVDYLDKIISKRKEALDKKKSYYEYDKNIKSQSKDINSLKAQIQALEGVK